MFRFCLLVIVNRLGGLLVHRAGFSFCVCLFACFGKGAVCSCVSCRLQQMFHISVSPPPPPANTFASKKDLQWSHSVSILFPSSVSLFLGKYVWMHHSQGLIAGEVTAECCNVLCRHDFMTSGQARKSVAYDVICQKVFEHLMCQIQQVHTEPEQPSAAEGNPLLLLLFICSHWGRGTYFTRVHFHFRMDWKLTNPLMYQSILCHQTLISDLGWDKRWVFNGENVMPAGFHPSTTHLRQCLCSAC